MARLSVIIMAFNEAATLRSTAAELSEVLATLDIDWDILIIDDGSTDGTSAIADALADDARLRVLHHPRNLGLGSVYASAFEHATGDFVIFFPADGQFPAILLSRYLEAVSDADMVFGYLPQRRTSATARMLSALERLLYRLLFGPLPRYQGVMMLRRTLLDEIPLKSPPGRSWVNVFELIVRAQRRGYRMVSIPVTLRPRSTGTSKVNNLRTILANLREVLKLRATLDEPVRPRRS